ncbi:MAG TPA: hypothetical protein VJT73_20745, partial [Polyangiaceae bacterium]|nr:hypothetical protein [Polyangiaceae bacterium]
MTLRSAVAALTVSTGVSCSSSPRPSAAPIVAPPLAASAPLTPDAAPVPDDAGRKVADFLSRIALVRELAPRAPVEARVLDRAKLIASVREHVAREVPPEVIRNQGELLVGFGLVPPGFDYEEGAFKLLEAQLAGFYEPHDKKMYLAGDLQDRAADATLAHELVHALQDQYYDLGTRLAYQAEANDRESALQALAEGDATSAMMDLMLSSAHRRAIDVPDEVFAAEVEASMSTSPDTAGVPRVLRASLVAPYVDGVLFVHALRRRNAAAKGTAGWLAVDDAWRAPPQTTEQLLHLEKYDAHETPEVLAAPPPPSKDKWVASYDDVFGEQGFRIAVEEWLPKKGAAGAAAGWAGDRAVLFRLSPPDSPPESEAQRGPTRFAAAWH